MVTKSKSLIVLARDHYKMILLFVLILLPVFIFFTLAREVIEKNSLAFDEPILLFIHSYASPFLNVFFTTITHLGDSVIMIIVAMIFAIYLAYKRIYQKALILVFSMGGVAVANSVLKFIFQRDRPTLWQHIVAETNFSFPSGHAMISAGFATALIVLFWNTQYRWLTVAVATIGMLLVGLSRLYLGVHYPSDILAGWCVSVAWVLLVSAGLLHFSRRKTDNLT